MPKRLLFVDDEVMVLQGLRRSLHGMRGEWEMTFVGSAAEALQALEQQTYDAVVSDMRMPLMDGAQLLEKIKDDHPEIVRMVLSGQSSREAVFRSIAPAHQFLAKPCDPKELTLRLTQAFAMRDLLENPALKTVVSGLRSIPSLPTLYHELTAALRSEDTSLVRIEQIISKDVGMAAKILQLANSAFIGVRGQVSSLLQALSLIGTEMVRTLVLSVHVFSEFDSHTEVSAHLPALWAHSIAVGGIAQRIASVETHSKSITEESFTAGLLHEVGKVVLLAEMPREYRIIVDAAANTPTDTLRLEHQHLGCTHAQVGAYLMSIWGLPSPLVHAVAFHHCPAESAETAFSPLTAVHVADAIVGESDALPLNRDIELDRAYLGRLSMREKEAVWRGFHQERLAAQLEGEARERKDSLCG